MIRYVAFLRGINISGKNKISMAELKVGFEALDFAEVKTYLNSGNVIFSSNVDGKEEIRRQLETMIKETFGLEIPVFILSQEELKDILCHAPLWWGSEDKELYDNLIFILPPESFRTIFHAIGAPKAGLEQIEDYKETVFWSFQRKEYQKTNWWSKTASAAIGSALTIRTAGTVRKVCTM